MNAPTAPIPAVASTESAAHTRLRNPWLSVARAAWAALVVPTIVLFGVGLLLGFGQLRAVCAGGLCHPVQLTAAEAELQRQLGLSLDLYAWYTTLTFAVFGSVFFAVGGLIFWRRSDDWMALFVSLILVMIAAGAVPVISSLGMIQPQWGWVGLVLALTGVLSLPALLALFPDGRFVPRWMGWLLLPWLVYVVVTVLATPMPRAGVLGGPPSPITLAALLAGGAAQVHRYRRVSTPLQRQQTKWAMLGIAGQLVCLLALVVAVALFPALTDPGLPGLVFKRYGFAVVGLLPLLLIPVAIAVSLLRYRLWDADVVINRALVYGALTASVVGVYVLVVGALGALFQTRGSLLLAVLATGFAALVFQPLRQRLQRAVNRLMYGERDDPYAVLSRLGQRLGGTLAPDAVLPTVVATVREMLRLPYVAIYLQEGPGAFRLGAESAAPALRRDDGAWAVPGMGTDGLREPLTYRGETVGYIVLGPHAPGEAFSPAERRLLAALARQAGVAVHGVRLTAELQRAREQLVGAREEERRRLRRDLHDGLGSRLAALHLRAGTLRTSLPRGAAAADAGLLELQAEIHAAIADIRRLVYQLRPPALDELGLTVALRGLAARCTAADGLRVRLDAPEHLPPLPAAVEVAAYRIAQEALANVVRHARARACDIRLVLADELRLEIQDDGIGLPPARHAGVGLRSMRERAAELGGTWAIETAPGGGARVLVRLPLPPAHA